MNQKRRKLLQQEPRLVQRYMRMRMRKRAIGFARFFMRFILKIQERKRGKAIKSALTATAEQATKSHRNGFDSSAVLFNLALFLLIAERDIHAVKVDALTHPDPWKRSLAARVILLTIHELNLDKVAGQKLKKALNDAQVSDTTKQRIIVALRNIRIAQQSAQRQYAFLRNATIAHRDAKAIIQYRTITELDEMEVLRAATRFYEAIHDFMSVLPDAVLEVGSFHGLLKQMQAKAKQP